VGSNVHIGEGAIINARTVIAPNAFLDDFCSLNRATLVGHDVRIGKYTRVGPAVALAGNTRIGDKCSIGMSASVLDRVKIGDWTVIGAGALVTRDIPEKVVAYGIPARIIRPNDRFVNLQNHAIVTDRVTRRPPLQ
jgi:acetyltransferase-like isoleucine patch superfamily enzyme